MFKEEPKCFLTHFLWGKARFSTRKWKDFIDSSQPIIIFSESHARAREGILFLFKVLITRKRKPDGWWPESSNKALELSFKMVPNRSLRDLLPVVSQKKKSRNLLSIQTSTAYINFVSISARNHF